MGFNIFEEEVSSTSEWAIYFQLVTNRDVAEGMLSIMCRLIISSDQLFTSLAHYCTFGTRLVVTSNSPTLQAFCLTTIFTFCRPERALFLLK
jgi:hypothetical protein